MIPARLRPAQARAAGWWEARSPREQRLLAGLGVVALLALVLVAVVRPLEATRARALADLRVADMLAMRAAGGDLAPGVSAGPPGAAVQRAAAGAGVAVARVEPAGGRLTVDLADAPFEGVLRFVAALEAAGSPRIAEARIERSAATPGLVSAHFVVTG